MKLLAVTLALVAVSGCGFRTGGTAPVRVTDREWAGSATMLLDGIDEALTRIADAGFGRATLHGTSRLYAALLGYTYLGSCGEMLANMGEPMPRLADVRDQIHASCNRLEHASTLFTRAVQRESPSLLAEAGRETLGTASQLQRTHALLRRLSRNSGTNGS
jgi:hypothetical protein